MADISFDERRRMIEVALRASRGPGSTAYIIELYDDRAVWADYEAAPDKTYEASYSLADDGAVTFGKSVEVERQVSYMAVKSVGQDLIEGPVFLFGPKDLSAERFDGATDFCLEWFGKSGRPLLYEHGLDRAMKTGLVGRQSDYDVRAEGIWAQSQLDRNARYRKAVDQLIDQGALAYSGGAMEHLATKNPATGTIKRFPWVELSLTPTPAQPANASIYYLKSADAIAHLDEAGMVLTDPLKAALAALDEWAVARDDEALPDGASFADVIDRLTVDAAARVAARKDWHLKSGRVLAAMTRERLAQHPAALRELADNLDELLATVDRPLKGAADLWQLSIDAEAAMARMLGVPVPTPGAPT